MDVLIAGCGYVGRKLGENLAARGLDVIGLRRNPPRETSDGLRYLRGDLGHIEGLAELCEGARAVVYAAAAESYHDEAYRLAYVEGPRVLMARLQALGALPDRFVFVSSTGVYHQDDCSWVDERSPTEPEGFSGRRLLEGESSLAAFPCPTVTLRCGGIYGPGRRMTIDSFLRGDARLDGQPPTYSNRIHRDDVAGALEHLLELEHPERLYLGVDHDPASRDDVWRWLAVETGSPLPPAREGVAPDRRHGGSKRCKNDRLVDSGYVFRFPSFREGFRSLL